MDKGTEAQKYVWGGEVPLQIHLDESEVTTLPPPPPVLILAPRRGYLPLLVNQIKPLFHSALPPGDDAVWFEYKGLPLKWYVPTGVLFDLLCAEPERPWNIKVHFRGYPGNLLTHCAGEDDVKWSFINSLKEAAYIINGNCKNVMGMSQSDQSELWQSVLNGNLESFLHVASKLKLTAIEDEFTGKLYSSLKPQASVGNIENTGPTKTGNLRLSDGVKPQYSYRDVQEAFHMLNGVDLAFLCLRPDTNLLRKWQNESKGLKCSKSFDGSPNLFLLPMALHYLNPNWKQFDGNGKLLDILAATQTVAQYTGASRIPVRLYVWNVNEDFVDLENAPDIDSWESICYINRPIEVHSAEGKCFTLNDALKALLPEYFGENRHNNEKRAAQEVKELSGIDDTIVVSAETREQLMVKLVRIQGIEPKLEIPFSWVANNLMNPDHFLHICLYLKSL